MIRRRLSPSVLDYQRTRYNRDWKDSLLRVNVSGGLVAYTKPSLVADLACGADAAVLAVANRIDPFGYAFLSDISSPSIDALDVGFPHEKKVMGALESARGMPVVDTMVLTEILEHLEDPEALLREVKAEFLVASSPNLEPDGYTNPEHVWEWDTEAYADMLRSTGWRPMALTLLDLPFVADELLHVPTQTQLWLARKMR